MSRTKGARDKNPRRPYVMKIKLPLLICKLESCGKLFRPHSNGQLHCSAGCARKTLYKSNNKWAHKWTNKKYRTDPVYRAKNLAYQKWWRDNHKK
jgi:hypothetical protein